MPDDFEAESDFHLLTAANQVQRDKSRVARAQRYAERKAAEFKQQATDTFGEVLSKPMDGSPRETSFKKRGK